MRSDDTNGTQPAVRKEAKLDRVDHDRDQGWSPNPSDAPAPGCGDKLSRVVLCETIVPGEGSALGPRDKRRKKKRVAACEQLAEAKVEPEEELATQEDEEEEEEEEEEQEKERGGVGNREQEEKWREAEEEEKEASAVQTKEFVIYAR